MLYYIYFPAIMQGPIERYGSFEERLFPSAKIRLTYENIRQAGILILHGFFKVFVISRFCALYTSSMNDPGGKNAIFLLMAIFLYSLQIYTDFSGSIDLVRGLSYLFGIELSENFRLPYLSQSFSEFWKRWHITFSSWLKDYIYIPLGGSRCKKSRVYLNLLIVFAVSGIWHGFSLTFLIWGLLQAVYQIIERIFKRKKQSKKNSDKVPFIIYISKSCKVFLLSTFAWIFFNAESLSHVRHLFSAIISSFKSIPEVGSRVFLDAMNHNFVSISVSEKSFIFHLVLIAAMTLFAVMKDRRGFDITDVQKVKVGFRWTYYIIMLVLIFTFGYFGDTFNLNSFIYGAF
ncbi:MAG: hypothetical protein K5756_05095 [Clostridiales bacterium]|nr:hypothetical protein [Clostridiales bacterium]